MIFRRNKKNKNTAQHEAQKSYDLGFGNGDGIPYAGAKINPLQRTKWGASLAYLEVHQIHVCVSLIVNMVAGLKWTIKSYHGKDAHGKDAEEGGIIASSDDIFPRHDFAFAMRDFRARESQSLIYAIAYDRTMYGEVYIEKSTDTDHYFFGNKTLDWLNPLGVSRNVINGRIVDFMYGWDSEFVRIPPIKMAYMHTRHPHDDNAGYSRVMAAMSKTNIERNIDQFVDDFYANGAMPGLVVQPSGNVATFSPQDQQNMERKLREQFKGLGNQFRSLVLQRQAELTPLESGGYDKQYNVESEVSTQIFEAMGVPQAMAGNTSATPYKDGDETVTRFFFGTILPEATEIQRYINESLMPFFDPSGRTLFEFDTSPFDTVTEQDKLEADVVNSQLTGGYLSLAQAAQIQERPVETWMENRYMYEGLPMTPAQIDAMIEAKIAQAQFASLPQVPMFPGQFPSLGETDDFSTGEFVVSRTAPLRHDKSCHCTDMASDDEFDHTQVDWLDLYEGNDLFPHEDVIEDRIRRELKQWSNRTKKQFYKTEISPFVTHVTPVWIRHAVHDAIAGCEEKYHVKEAFAGILDNPRIKTIRGYQAGLRSLVTGLWRGELDPGQFTRGMNQLIEVQFRQAFIQEGFGRAGIPESEISQSELNVLNELIATEQSNIGGLMLAVQENARERGGKLNPLRARVDRWTARFIGVSERAFTLAMRDKPLKWVFDPKKEHCRSCLRLNGQVRRANKWAEIGIYPRSPELDCFGLYCGCKWEDAEGEPLSRGRVPSF